MNALLKFEPPLRKFFGAWALAACSIVLLGYAKPGTINGLAGFLVGWFGVVLAFRMAVGAFRNLVSAVIGTAEDGDALSKKPPKR